MEAVQYHEGRAKHLEEEIQDLDERISLYTYRPYLDPKEVRVKGWNMLKGTWQGEV